MKIKTITLLSALLIAACGDDGPTTVNLDDGFVVINNSKGISTDRAADMTATAWTATAECMAVDYNPRVTVKWVNVRDNDGMYSNQFFPHNLSIEITEFYGIDPENIDNWYGRNLRHAFTHYVRWVEHGIQPDDHNDWPGC